MMTTDSFWLFILFLLTFCFVCLCYFFLFFFLGGGGGGGHIEKLRRKTRKQLSSFSFSIHARNISNIAYTCCRDRLHLILSGGQISKLI